MSAVTTIAEEIDALRRERKAVILAHHYQDSEIQELADVIGDSLELARKAREYDGEVIAFCGVWFMAETAKILNPTRTVVVPDAGAGCSLVDACSGDQVRAFKRRYPDHVVVSYINTSADVKAESDIICTSRNAVKVVESIPADQPILFLPDINLGNWVQRQTGRTNMRIWQGACIVHATFPARRLLRMKAEHPNALVAAHPECPGDVLSQADFIGSTSAIIEWAVTAPRDEIIVMTESGVRHSLEKLAPNKKFVFVPNENCNCSECPYMKMNSLEKLRDCLDALEPRVELPADIMERALVPIERMLALK
ncbi:MAG TPA: quinolinate synthase NadA [Bryobacteraceae bacterium]|jgi:quinolinate synthase|nr:quinolinate synthase NadA [Bryobacteraceae bacterium]